MIKGYTMDGISVLDRPKSKNHIKKEVLIFCLMKINSENRDFIEELVIHPEMGEIKIVLKKQDDFYILITAYKS